MSASAGTQAFQGEGRALQVTGESSSSPHQLQSQLQRIPSQPAGDKASHKRFAGQPAKANLQEAPARGQQPAPRTAMHIVPAELAGARRSISARAGMEGC
jgi:hypothetical protein